MKKLIVLPMLLLATMAMAQLNIQLHGDFGRALYPTDEANRQFFTTTVEYFGADKLGSTFLFVDMDYRGKTDADGKNSGVVGAYWEVSREFTFAKVKNSNHSFAAHIEYDGGLNRYGSFQQAFLVGPAWNWHNNNFSKTFSLQAMFKQYLAGAGNAALSGGQLTAVWGMTFANNWLTFSGFADVWYGYSGMCVNTSKVFTEGADPTYNEKNVVFLTEPQLWVNVINRGKSGKKLSVGTEIEMSTNFIYSDNLDTSRRFFVNPTLAVKYTF